MAFHQISGIRVRTTHEFPSIPVRDFDWSAIDDDTYDGEGSLIGHGASEEDAIDDLMCQIQWKREESSEREEEPGCALEAKWDHARDERKHAC